MWNLPIFINTEPLQNSLLSLLLELNLWQVPQKYPAIFMAFKGNQKILVFQGSQGFPGCLCKSLSKKWYGTASRPGANFVEVPLKICAMRGINSWPQRFAVETTKPQAAFFLLKIWEGRMKNSQHLPPSSEITQHWIPAPGIASCTSSWDQSWPSASFSTGEAGPKNTSCDLQHFPSLRGHGFFLEMHFLSSPFWGPAI